jgi:hypothetical protein
MTGKPFCEVTAAEPIAASFTEIDMIDGVPPG